MKKALSTAILILALSLCGTPMRAVCPPSCPTTGGGPVEDDCHAEFASPVLQLNFPPYDPAAPQPRTEVRCFDGDPGCDSDGAIDGSCLFDIDLCLRNDDPALAGCVPSDVTSATVLAADGNADLEALQSALDALLPATSNVCTSGQRLHASAKGDPAAVPKRGEAMVVVEMGTESGATDHDELRLSCVARRWPAHGYGPANHRATPFETSLNPNNVGALRMKWKFDLAAQTNGLSAVTSTPTVGNGMVYVTAWDGKVYALDPGDGSIIWTYDSEAGFTGLQSSATLTADGRLLVGDATASLHCLDARDGKLLWKVRLASPDTNHVWASPAVANGRVFIGLASHTDNPCTQGLLVALDLDTGEELWRFKTVPDMICDNDTAVACSSDDDCGGGACITGRSGGVTATVAIDPSGETVYMNTVGCYTYPSIGDSDSIFRFDAATGNLVWKRRVQQPEQFSACQDDPTIDCRTRDDCGGGACMKKGIYHDFGFLNGPILVEADDGLGGTRRLAVSGSKDGTLYALDQEDGSIVWTNEVVPTPFTPGFAGYGLFNGAVGYANQRFYAALNDVIPSGKPDHVQAFSAVDGSTVWSDELTQSWGDAAIANGVLFVGTNEAANLCDNDPEQSCDPDGTDGECGGGACVTRGYFYAYDTDSGAQLRRFVVPSPLAGGASIVDGNVYVPYGILTSPGGVVAFSLPCGGDCNDDGEVNIDELISGVNIALDRETLDSCPVFDRNGDGTVAVNELVGAVSNALVGCA